MSKPVQGSFTRVEAIKPFGLLQAGEQGTMHPDDVAEAVKNGLVKVIGKEIPKAETINVDKDKK